MSTPTRPRGLDRIAWAIPLVMLGAIAVGVLIVRNAPGWIGPAMVSVLVGAGLLWVGVSVFWPAKADRKCPRCEEEALERLDPDTTQGLKCASCGFVDEQATGWFLAEDEGPLEDLVLRQRAAKREAKRARRRARA